MSEPVAEALLAAAERESSIVQVGLSWGRNSSLRKGTCGSASEVPAYLLRLVSGRRNKGEEVLSTRRPCQGVPAGGSCFRDCYSPS